MVSLAILGISSSGNPHRW